MADLLQEIEAQIAGARATTAKQNVGVIREIGDGVARVEGLTDAMLNEMLDLGHGITGLALDLDETEVRVIILGDYLREKISSTEIASVNAFSALTGTIARQAPSSQVIRELCAPDRCRFLHHEL